MITKAGVPNNKIIGGVASYGRSFGIKDPSCHGPECHFTGPKSGAEPGECTKTPGYIANAEIQRWLNSSKKITSYWDDVSRSNISYSADGTWVAYNDQAERDARMWDWWLNLHMGGTVLWAMDLTEFVSEYANGTRMEPPQAVDCSRSFDNLDDLEAATDIDDFCMNTYIMQALSRNLTASLDKYHDLLDNDYNEKFGYYADAVKKSAPTSLSKFTAANASTYFTCYKSIQNDDGTYTNYTDKGCFSEHMSENDIYWVPHDKTKFEDDLTATSGISADWLKWGTKDEREHDGYTGEEWSCHYHGVPMMKDDYKVDNPKDVVSKRLPNIKDFHETLDFTAFLSQQSLYSGEGSDVVDGAGMLVFMVSSSVANMEQVSEIGEEVEEEEILNTVLWFVTAVLFLIPGLEEDAVALDLVNLARMLRMIGSVRDAGMSVYNVVVSKGNAPAAIFGLLLGGLSVVKAPKSFGEAAKARRGMRASDIDSLGTQVKGGLGQVDRLVKRCY
ncbi:LysM domain protein [Aspergillus sclerotialis]|uniref:LysM domain protein n=1 Tax=Aspergillus sclerotialis TaxID=2070753 RepID=A0A3A2Z3F1_9EURO|nr:LysM domain protein [Aspergillus sclerotialis]